MRNVPAVRNYVKITVSGLAIRIPPTPMGLSGAGVHSTSYPFYCEIRVQGLSSSPPHTAPVELALASGPPPDPSVTNVSFYLNESEMAQLLSSNTSSRKSHFLEIDILAGRDSWWGLRSARSLGSLKIPITRDWIDPRSTFQPAWGWSSIGKKTNKSQTGIHLHACVKVESDSRHVLSFESRAYLSPQIVQVHGGMRQPIFSCKFGLRIPPSQSTSSPMSASSKGTFWSVLGSKSSKAERKGWSISVHDLSGSPVAAASMITPFVPTSGSGKVSRSNPGAWLIMKNDRNARSNEIVMKPWGRLEAWRERGNDNIGFRFELIGEKIVSPSGQIMPLVSRTRISYKDGGSFSLCTLPPPPRKPVTPGLVSTSSRASLQRRNSMDHSFTPIDVLSPSISGRKNDLSSSSFSSSAKSGRDSSSSSSTSSSSSSSSAFADASMAQFTEDVILSMEVGKDTPQGGRVSIEVGKKSMHRVDDAGVLIALASAVELSIEACQNVSKGLKQVLKRLENDDKWAYA